MTIIVVMAREDGTFELYYSEGYAVLTVHPPGEGGMPVYSDDVQNRMRILNIPRVAAGIIQEIIDSAGGKPEKLVEWPAGEELSASVIVEIADDDLTAAVTIQHPKKGGGRPSRGELLAALSKAGVSCGIDDDAIDSLLQGDMLDTPVCVARAVAPVHGVPAVVEYTFETVVGKPFLVDDSGKIDLRELNFIQQKHVGDVLARFIDPITPTDGKTVRSAAIPATPAAAPQLVRAGEHTELSPDGREIRSLIDGNVFLKGGVIHIEPVVVVESVDYSTGNISFEGTVQVRHTIADGFTVHAGGSLEIGESIGRVALSAGRDLILKGGMNGGDEGSATAGGDIYAKYIEGAKISASGNLFVTDAIMHSSIIVSGGLGLRGKHAGIIGGSILVGGGLWCKRIGSVSETPTRVAVGTDVERLQEYGDLSARVERLHDRIDDLDRILHYLEARVRSGNATESQREEYAKVQAERAGNGEELAGFEERLKDLRSQMIPSVKVRVVVEELIYPRVTVNFGRVEYRTTNAGATKTILKCIEGKVIEAGFNPSDPPDFAEVVGVTAAEAQEASSSDAHT